MEVREGYKKTEMGVIPGDWEVIKLAEKSTLKARIGWQGLTTKEYLSFGNYYLVTGTDLIDNQIDWRNCCYVDKSRYEQDKNIQIKDGDLLVTKDGTIGKIAYIENMKKPATLNSGVFVIRPVGGSYLPKYLFYVLSSTYFVNFLKQLTAGSTIIHLYQKDFVKFNFLLPPLPEQQAIAEALSDVDNLISSLTKLINKKKNIKQGAMQELLTGKKRLEGFSGDWKKTFLGEIADTSSGGTPSRSNPKYYSGNIPWVTTSELNDKSIHDTNEHITQEGVNSSSAKIFPEYTVLIAMYGATIGKLGILAMQASTNQACCALICNKEILDYKFLFYKLLSMREYIISLGCGAGQPNISQKIIKSLEILIPMLPEQTAIAGILSDMDAEIEVLEQKLNKYKAIKQGMMHELLTGRIRLI